ncbi:uncharacterized protein BJX67DRAFT_386096 [Aspergillus lucknowensis]|uniref:Uncharacterized protein n=1 Tax=Aspergillus lucknowensis TaxID=176173 RepID=A0ABR4L943_9EURO
MGLFNVEENGAQPVFFSPAKVELVRQRQMDQEQADEQCKQAIEDRRLQTVIAREEKARESAEKKKQRAAARQALQERRAREKAERAAEREAKRAQKLEEVAKQKAERIARKAELQAIREAKLRAAGASKAGQRGHKRQGSRAKSERPPKQPRATSTQQCNNKKGGKATAESKSLVDRSYNSTSLIATATPVVQRKRRQMWKPVSQSLRSGRVTKPPADNL